MAELSNTLSDIDFTWLEKQGLYIAAGFLTTTSTLSDKLAINHAQRFITAKELKSIAPTPLHRVKYIIHHRSDSQNQLLNDMCKIAELSKDAFSAIQIDEISGLAFPDAKILKSFTRKYPQITLILQVGPQALEKIGSDLLLLRRELAQYSKIVGGLLLDRSDSRGIQLDPNELSPIVQMLSEDFPDYHLIIAGGLNTMNMSCISSLFKINSKLSIDAESVFFEGKGEDEVFNTSTIQEYLSAYKKALEI